MGKVKKSLSGDRRFDTVFVVNDHRLLPAVFYPITGVVSQTSEEESPGVEGETMWTVNLMPQKELKRRLIDKPGALPPLHHRPLPRLNRPLVRHTFEGW